MKTTVSIPTGELRRLFLKAVNGKTFSRRMILEMVNTLLARVERDYPEAIHGIYQKVYAMRQDEISNSIERQRNNLLRRIDGGNYE